MDATPAGLDRPLGDALLEPHRNYLAVLDDAVTAGHVKALAHITGGGLLENIPRVLPSNLHAFVDADSWPQTRLMAFLQAQGNIEPEEFARTFNCGIGMVLIVAEDSFNNVSQALETAGETVWKIGVVENGARGCTVNGSPGTWSGRSRWSASHHG